MWFLTKKKQREIEKCRNTIYKYISSHPENVKEATKAIEALCDISCDCGIWSSPWKEREEKGE